ncbi:MAG: hypothetical protein E7087_05260 [Bacteroidales bacterium]|nr:hypothetical protein [Bacteroidales bacterium]
MKKLTILSLLLMVGFAAYAQGKRVETTTKTESVTVDYKTQYKSSFFDNIYVQGSFGGAVLMGEQDSHLSFKDRVKHGFAIAIGKQITPVFGVRLSVDGNRLKGWNAGGGIYPNYLEDPRKVYLESKGVDTRFGYIQDLKYYSLGADVMVNLINLFSKEKKSDRAVDVELYIGAAALTTIERKGVDGRTLFAARGGLSTTYNVTKRIGINIDLGVTGTSSTFDGQSGMKTDFDGILSGKVGLKWKIGKQGFRTTHAISSEQYAALSNYLAMVKTEQMEKGKPEEKVVVIPAEKDNILIPYVVFHDGKDTFNQELQMVNISNVAKLMQANPQYTIEIVGNTNATKAEIAESRANKVKEILVNRYSVNADKLVVKTEDMGDNSQTVHFITK